MSGRIAIGRWLTTGVASALALFLVASGSAVELPWHDDNAARIRLSWSARPERIETCRALSAEEIAKQPAHMRRRVECTGRFATYLLRVEADGHVLDERVVRGAGLRNDRPLYLVDDYALDAGVHRIRVTFTRREQTDDDAAVLGPVAPAGVDSGIYAGRAERESEERSRRAKAAVPRRMQLDSALTFGPGQVRLVTFDRDARTLVVR